MFQPDGYISFRRARPYPFPAAPLLLSAILFGPAVCMAQDAPKFHSCTFNLGAGPAWPLQTEKDSLDRGWNFNAGLGFALASPQDSQRSWIPFLNANFVFDRLDIGAAALQQAQTLNPTNVALLGATGGNATFYSVTLDPTFRFSMKNRAELYAFGGFGWFRRKLEFTGPTAEGALLQPGNPAVFGSGGDSGAFDVGAGLNVRLPGHARAFMLYVEGRYIHGLAVNHRTTLAPVSLGFRW